MVPEGEERREGVLPFFRMPGARSAVVAEGAGPLIALEVMAIIVNRSARQDRRLMLLIMDITTRKRTDQLNEYDACDEGSWRQVSIRKIR